MTDQNQVNANNESLAIINLVAMILPLVVQYGVPLVDKVVTSIKQDPNLPAEQIAAAIQKRLEDASAIDKQILNDQS